MKNYARAHKGNLYEVSLTDDYSVIARTNRQETDCVQFRSPQVAMAEYNRRVYNLKGMR